MPGAFDVIIIGLGPAGAAAAWQLARAGARVLVLDGSGGRSKPCGGCLSRRWDWLLDQMDPPDWLRRHALNRLWLGAPEAASVCWDTDEAGAWLVDRAMLDAWLASCAREAGARVVAGRARHLRADGNGFRVESDQGAFRSSWLVGADGAGGICGRLLGLGRGGLRFRALVEERPLSHGLARRLAGGAMLELCRVGDSGGYGWAFARGDVLNLGLGCVQTRGLTTARMARAYAKFLARRGLGAPGRWRGWVIPCPDGRGVELSRGQACLAGDAGILGDPFLGEGIGPALFSGRQAAFAIMGGGFDDYAMSLRGLLREHHHGRLLARLIYGRPGFFQGLTRRWPGALELGFAVLRGELSQAGLWSAVAARIMGRKPVLDRDAIGYYSKHL